MSNKTKLCSIMNDKDKLPKMPVSKTTWVSQSVIDDFNKRKYVYTVRGNVQYTYGGD